MEVDEEQYMQELEEELKQAQAERRNLAKAQLGMYESNPEDNLAKWQLSLTEEKQRIYHLLKAHRQAINDKGEEVWVAPDDPSSAILNDYGVDYIMSLYEAFVNKNVILSFFEEDRINEICLDLSDQIINDVFNDYERMGLDDENKRKRFGILVWQIIINIEATLRRAMSGGERRTLRAITTITQNETPQRQYSNIPTVGGQQQRRLLHPSTW